MTLVDTLTYDSDWKFHLKSYLNQAVQYKLIRLLSHTKVDDGRCHHDADALQQVSDHVDEGGTNARVALATKERVAVAVADRSLAVLFDLVITPAVGVEGGGVMEDVGHAVEHRGTPGFTYC